MNESETNSSAQTELMDQIVALRHQVFTLLLALVVVLEGQLRRCRDLV